MLGCNLASPPSPDVDFLQGPDFECWTAIKSESPKNLGLNQGRLLVGYEYKPEWLNLYQFDLTDTTYTLVVSETDIYDNQILSPVSPNGQYLWYSRFQGPSNSSVFLYNLTDNSTRQIFAQELVPSPGGVLSWSADGRCLFLRQLDYSIAYRLPDGVMQKKPAYDPSELSASGQWRAWPCRRTICVTNLAGQRISDPRLNIPTERDAFVWWSPTADVLALAYESSEFHYWDMVRIVELKEGKIVFSRDISAPALSGLRWSPTGDKLLIADGNGKTLLIYDRPTDTVRSVSSPGNYSHIFVPVWSPNGEQIASISENYQNVYIMSAHGTNPFTIPALHTGTSDSWPIRSIFWMP